MRSNFDFRGRVVRSRRDLGSARAFYASLGAGYQFDLGSAEYRLWNEPAQELSFAGVSLRASLGLRF